MCDDPHGAAHLRPALRSQRGREQRGFGGALCRHGLRADRDCRLHVGSLWILWGEVGLVGVRLGLVFRAQVSSKRVPLQHGGLATCPVPRAHKH